MMMMQQNHFQMPFILEGEVISAEDEPLLDHEEAERGVGYAVLVTFPNGSRTVFRRVMQACLFGGIGDFGQFRLRGNKDASGSFKMPEEPAEAPSTVTTVGSRVLVAFIGGDMRKPAIVGFLPHPQRTFDIPETIADGTQAKIAYKGIEMKVDSVGQMTVLHRGSPAEVDGFTGEGCEFLQREDVGPQELPERELLEPLPTPALLPNVPSALPTAPTSAEPTVNEQLVYPDPKYTTECGFRQLGEWYVVDTEGQAIFMDRDSKTFTITNSQEIIQLDKEHKKIFIVGSGDMETRLAGDDVKSIVGSYHRTVDQNAWKATKGNENIQIGNSRTTNVVDKDSSTVGSLWGVDIGTAETVPGGTGKSQDKHQAHITLSTGNSFVMDDDAIFIIHKTGAMTTIDKDGNITIVAKDGSNVYLNAKASAITAMSKKGGMISIDDKITAIDKTGKQMIVVKDGSVEITANAQVTVSAKSVSLNAANVALGNQATFSAVVGETLQAWLDAHTHLTPAGMSLPPTIPSASLKGSPADILSVAVKIRKGM